MAHFEIQQDQDGKICEIIRDGKKVAAPFKLEQPDSIVKIYFDIASSSLLQLETVEQHEKRRAFGLQSFLMSLTGLEAFANTYFQMRGDELSNPSIKELINKESGKMTERLKTLIKAVGDGPLVDQQDLIASIGQLAAARNGLVHPKWAQSTIEFGSQGPFISGLVENPHIPFESPVYCRRALLTCLLFVARVAEVRKVQQMEAFIFRWTGISNISLPGLLSELKKLRK